MSHRRILTSLAGLAAAALAVPALAASPSTAAPAPDSHSSHVSTAATRAAYVGSPQDEAATKAFYDAVMKSARAKMAEQTQRGPGSAGRKVTAVTVTYAVDAPTFASQIASSSSIWNSSVSNVKLVEGSNYDFYYTEGNDPRGSYASTDGHGSGYVFIDYAQSQQYDKTRIVAHETGHVLGLPDHYSGPCSELMSGGGPGPSCTNPYPDATERSKVNALWANGFANATKAAFHTSK